MGGHIHVAGVAGVGMSALAQALSWTHARVTGSDRYFDQGFPLPIFDALRAGGVEIVKQDGAAVDARSIRSQSRLIRAGAASEPAIRDRWCSHASRAIASTGWRIEVSGGETACIQE